jgi:hypothetical protein
MRRHSLPTAQDRTNHVCDHPEHCPWICHVCDATSTSESTTCSMCYKTTCAAHLKRTLLRNGQSGLYEIAPACAYCAASAAID